MASESGGRENSYDEIKELSEEVKNYVTGRMRIYFLMELEE